MSDDALLAAQAATIQATVAAAGYADVTIRFDEDNIMYVEGEVADDDAEAAVVEIVDDFDCAGLVVMLGYADVDDDDDDEAGQIDVAAAGHEMYTVAKGDSWWGITKRHYGDGRKWKLLKAANGSPKMLHPGHVLVLPPLDELEANA